MPPSEDPVWKWLHFLVIGAIVGWFLLVGWGVVEIVLWVTRK